MDEKYRVVFLDLTKSREAFHSGMARLGVSPFISERIIQTAPVILKGGMSLSGARRYAKAVQGAGGRVVIQEYGLSEEPQRTGESVGIEPFESFTMCPECGYKQLRADTCVKCGFLFKTGMTGRGKKNVRSR